MKKDRRSIFSSIFAGESESVSSEFRTSEPSPDNGIQQDVPLFSGYKKLGNLVFVSGHGARLEGDIKMHTDNVIKVIEEKLKSAGSSLDKVLKVNVYLNDINDIQGMNEVFKGRFGNNPPVRTTVAVTGGLPPADAYIQMDCIAYV
jgi:enamine deaminase RidA (YjgF/YER057c/UK114 family)